MVTCQTTGYVTQQIPCPKCGKSQSPKGKHQIVLRTLFSKLRLDSPRLYRCACCSKEKSRSFSPLAELLTERTAPELAYLESKFAAMISYGLTAELLAEVPELPLYLSPESEHWLDWFHVAMRLTVMGQMAKGLVNEQNMTSAIAKSGTERWNAWRQSDPGARAPDLSGADLKGIHLPESLL